MAGAPSTRRLAWVVALAAVSVLVAMAGPAQARPTFRLLAEDVPLEGFAIAGTTAVAFQAGQGWELWMHDLAGGPPRLLTSVPAANGVRIADLRFDGRWAAWSDDRTGDREVYAIDVATSRLLRVTQATGPDQDIALRDGRLAWVHELTLQTATLPDATDTTARPNASAPTSPALLPTGLAVARGPSLGRELVLLDSAGAASKVLAKAHGEAPVSAVAAGEAVAWLTEVLWDAEQPGLGVKGTTVHLALAPDYVPRTLVDEPTSARALAVTTDRACWLEGERLRCHLWVHERTTSWRAQGSALAVSPSHALLLQAEHEAATGDLKASAWAGAGIGAPGPGPAAVVVALVATTVAWRRPA